MPLYIASLRRFRLPLKVRTVCRFILTRLQSFHNLMRKLSSVPAITEHYPGALDRRRFLSSVGKGLGLAALSSSTVASLLKDVKAAAKRASNLSAEEAARE